MWRKTENEQKLTLHETYKQRSHFSKMSGTNEWDLCIQTTSRNRTVLRVGHTTGRRVEDMSRQTKDVKLNIINWTILQEDLQSCNEAIL
jgi:hypothetical protein